MVDNEMKSKEKKQMSKQMSRQRCKICKSIIFTWGVSGIDSRFMGKKITLNFEDFVMCDKCADMLRAAIKAAKGEV